VEPVTAPLNRRNWPNLLLDELVAVGLGCLNAVPVSSRTSSKRRPRKFLGNFPILWVRLLFWAECRAALAETPDR
jgi:hypothetical protein